MTLHCGGQLEMEANTSSGDTALQFCYVSVDPLECVLSLSVFAPT